MPVIGLGGGSGQLGGVGWRSGWVRSQSRFSRGVVSGCTQNEVRSQRLGVGSVCRVSRSVPGQVGSGLGRGSMSNG